MSPSKSAVPSKAAAKSVPKLADFLCFAIYSANLAYGRAYKPILDPLGLTYTQYIALVALWEEDNQTVSQLGERMFLESNTLTPILKKLESLGYLRRRRDSEDQRQDRDFGRGIGPVVDADRVAADDVTEFVRDHALQLVGIVGGVDQAGVDVDHLALRDEGVDLGILDEHDLDV